MDRLYLLVLRYIRIFLVAALLIAAISCAPHSARKGETISIDTYPVPPLPYKAVIADFDRNGWPDIAVVSKYSDVAVFFNSGTGKLSQPITLRAYYQPVSLAKGDLNRDGLIDLIPMTETMIGPFYLGNARGNFDRSDVRLYAPPFAFYIDASDLNNDGYDDLVTSGIGGQGPYIYINKGNLSFERLIIYLRAGQGISKSGKGERGDVQFISHHPFIIDIDGDGWRDILVPDEARGALWLLHNKKGIFEPSELFSEKGAVATSVSANLSNGKTNILLSLNKGSNEGELVYLQKTASGYQVSNRQKLPHIEHIALSDMDRDGKDEVIALIIRSGKSYICVYRMDGVNAVPVFESPMDGPRSFTTGDINRDGFNDLIIPDYDDNTLKVIYSPLRK